ncbi:hypothetical protein BDU57DRAFT_548711 [Ampelomyces quisqualis]|uniref:Zn(2)-C6 fungal-type domain-containing protein n=1 Tax=Ampelomyces quisqualis TaxID=50730 RepID=A0A6A5QT87_AMPQU|nr:hypothetical protein BDU57DRAFT_548711 [Ampelomyces quisqualis]
MSFSNVPLGNGYDPPKVPARPAVAIPRVQRVEQGKHATARRRRVLRACMACRGQKMRCNGVAPVCERCAANNTQCVYNLPRKDRLKIMASICDSMADTMRAIYPNANEADKMRIERDLKALDEATSAPQMRPITSAMTDTTSSNSPEDKESCGIDQQQDSGGLYLDQAPAYAGVMPAFFTEHVAVGNPVEYSTYDEVVADSSVEYLGEWDLSNIYTTYHDES